MRLVIVPRWAGNHDSDFYPWLLDRVGERFQSVRFARLLPVANSPTIEASVAELNAILAESDEPTLLLGHSVGNQVIMRSLAESDPGCVRACLMVAGWFEVDEPWPAIVPWTTEAIELAKTRAAVGSVRVLLSDNDPFTSDTQSQGERFARELGAQIRMVSGRKHFNDEEQDEVLEELLTLLGAVSN